MLILPLFIPKLGKVLATNVDIEPRPKSTRLTLKNLHKMPPYFEWKKFPPFIQSQQNAPQMEAWILLV
jgi:hypothetical protein